MYGSAFKCDQCGRLAFVEQQGAVSGPPPFGWFALSGVGEPDKVWPMWHFDTAQCLAEFTDGILPEVPKMTIDLSVLDETQPADPPEQVISEWDKDNDLTPFPDPTV